MTDEKGWTEERLETLKNLCKLLKIVSQKLQKNEELNSFSTHDFEEKIKKNYTRYWNAFLNFQISYMVSGKKFFGDYETFMYCFFTYKNILHCVCALEGIYVITINSDAYDYLMNSPSKQETKQKNIEKYIDGIYIDKELSINNRPKYNNKPITRHEQYVKFVNNYSMFKRKHMPLFKMFFIKWDQPQNEILCNPWKCKAEDSVCKKRSKNM